jgi:hypothetical protein
MIKPGLSESEEVELLRGPLGVEDELRLVNEWVMEGRDVIEDEPGEGRVLDRQGGSEEERIENLLYMRSFIH